MTSKNARKPIQPRELKRQLTVAKNKSAALADDNDVLADENADLKKRLDSLELAAAQAVQGAAAEPVPETEAEPEGFSGFTFEQGAKNPMDEVVAEGPEEVHLLAEDFPEEQTEIPTYSEDELTEAVAFLRSRDAKDNPVTKTGIYDSRDSEIGQFAERLISAVGDAKDAIESPQPILVQDKHYSPDKMKELAFMEEVIEVMVHDTDDPVKQPIPMVINDGIRQSFIRNQNLTVKRKFLEVLARCKTTTYSNQRYFDGDGNEAYKVVPHTTLMYPFQVINDPSPRGREWLQRIQSEPS
jgi:hypothetical protein